MHSIQDVHKEPPILSVAQLSIQHQQQVLVNQLSFQLHAGETLAIVEAMKMENVLRAERDLIVLKINASQGDSLAVDAIIMEFAA